MAPGVEIQVVYLGQVNKKDVNFKSYCYPDKIIEHGSVTELEQKYGLNNKDIIDTIICITNKYQLIYFLVLISLIK